MFVASTIPDARSEAKPPARSAARTAARSVFGAAARRGRVLRCARVRPARLGRRR